MSPGSEDEGSDYINASWLTGDDGDSDGEGVDDDCDGDDYINASWLTGDDDYGEGDDYINVDRKDGDYNFGNKDWIRILIILNSATYRFPLVWARYMTSRMTEEEEEKTFFFKTRSSEMNKHRG